MAPILASMEAPIDYTALELYRYIDLPWVMCFLLVPHLPSLIGWERRTALADKQADRQTDATKMSTINFDRQKVLSLFKPCKYINIKTAGEVK